MEQEYILIELLGAGLSQCHTVAVDNAGTLTSLFLVGLAGSASHCIGMCGPFVISQVTARLEGVPASQMSEFHRVRGAALVPYHFGRLTTYVVLGGLVGLVASGALGTGNLNGLAAGLLVFAAVFFLVYALRSLGVALPKLGSGGEGALGRMVGRIAHPLFDKPTGWRGYLLGLALGFLPCGLLYGALAAAASPGDWLAAALGMGAFAFGTIPALLVIGFAGHMAASRWQQTMRVVAPWILILNAGFLLYTAFKFVS